MTNASAPSSTAKRPCDAPKPRETRRDIRSRQTSKFSELPNSKSRICFFPSIATPSATTAVCSLLKRMPSSINTSQSPDAMSRSRKLATSLAPSFFQSLDTLDLLVFGEDG